MYVYKCLYDEEFHSMDGYVYIYVYAVKNFVKTPLLLNLLKVVNGLGVDNLTLIIVGGLILDGDLVSLI